MKQEEINKILENHLHWLNRDCDGWETMRANFYRADLYGANLCGATLCRANLGGANLHNANLCRADLYGADLHTANLLGANLDGAHLQRANLQEASLYNARLCGANLYKANLDGARLYGAKDIPFIPMTCPEEGSFIGYKKASVFIVKLEIVEEARRSSATGRKCRCDKAKVLSITNLDGTPTNLKEVASNYEDTFIYRVGEIVEEPKFCDDRFAECAEGIHFFINRQEAVDY